MDEVIARTDIHGDAATAAVKRDYWLPWVIWALVFVAVASSTSGLSAGTALEVVRVVGLALGTLAVATIGALVVSRGHAPIPGWLLIGFSFFWSAGIAAYHYLGLISENDPVDLTSARVLIHVGDVSYVLSLIGLIFLLLTVPDGAPPSPRWRLVAWGWGVLIPFWVVQSVLLARTVSDLDAWLNRTTLASLDGSDPSPVLAIVTNVATVMSGLWTLLIAFALISRYRSSRGEERQQLKWILLGGMVVILWFLIWILQPGGGFGGALQALIPGLALMSLAAGLGFALFKYRLWEVDVVIRRSLVYGILWLVIALVYVGVAAGFGLFAGSRFPVEVAIALTVLATMLFQPARRWLEGTADRLVFGRRDSPVKALHSFGAVIDESSRPRDVATELAEVCYRVLGVKAVMVEIEEAPSATVGDWTVGEEIKIPIGWGIERFGVVRCRTHKGEELDRDEIELIEALATQAALTVSHARLASRMVKTQEIERRRIERDIHDGVQQDLATQIGQLALARSRATGDVRLEASLGLIQEEMQRTLSEIRDLAQGIHPSVLRDGGLVAAIEDRCSHLPIRASIRVSRGLENRRYAADIEAAAYFTVTEAIANVVKHSGSPSLSIDLAEEDGSLVLNITDRGCGFDQEAVSNGSGIVGLSDRLQALGGELILESQPGHGSVLRAHLPAGTQETL